MRTSRLLPILLIACALSAHAAQPSPADLSRLNRSLNPTKTPNVYGLESHINAGGQDIDAQGNHLFARVTPGSSPKDNTEHRVAARVKPCKAFLPLWTQLGAFDEQVDAYQRDAIISRARANFFRERVALLRINYGVAHTPDGSKLSPSQIKGMTAELKEMNDSLLH